MYPETAGLMLRKSNIEHAELSQQSGFKKPPMQTIIKNEPQVQQIQKADTFQCGNR